MDTITIVTLSLMRGGAEGVIARLCNDTLVSNYKVNIVTCMNREVQYELDDRINIYSLDEVQVDYSNMAKRFVARRKRLKALLGKLNSSLIISFLPEPNFLVLSLKKKCACPVIISVRNDPEREYKNKIYNLIMKALYPKADGYVFQTDMARDYFAFNRHIINVARIIPNALADEYVNYIPVLNKAKRIVHVGRLDSQKNQKMLIDAFAAIAADYNEYNLDMYGSGRLLDELTEYVEDIGLKNRVIFHGNVSNLKEHIKDAGLFVLSSDYEGIPNSLMEALALGIPSIATNCPCGGPGLLIDDGSNGLLVPVGDKVALEQAMRRLLDDKELADSVSVKAVDSMKNFYPDVIHGKWDEYIKTFI